MKKSTLMILGCAVLLAVGLSIASVTVLADDSSGNMTGENNAVTEDHVIFIKGFEDGTIRPSKKLTYAEVQQMLSNLGLEKAPDLKSFASSPEITRGVFSEMLIEKKNGLKQSDILLGYPDGSLGLDNTLTRAEAVTMINRALGRVADRMSVAMSTDIRVLPDMTTDHWAYYQFIEAMTEHSSTLVNGSEEWILHEPGTVNLSTGWHNIEGELFYVDENKLFLYNALENGLELNENGRYTTGNDTLDKLLTDEVKLVVSDKMSQEDKLRSLYEYMKASYGYRGSDTVAPGTSGWEEERAITMIQNKKGNCYDWAAAFTYMARKVGYNANAVIGSAVSPKGSTREHAWTEIMIDYNAYVCDPEIEGVYGKTTGETYDLFMKEYASASWQYNKIEVEPDPPVVQDPSTEEVDENLSAILDKVYEGIETPMMMNRVNVTSENEKYYLGTEGLKYKKGIGSESSVTAIAHSIVLIEMEDGADIEAAKKEIKEKVDGNKWICVGVGDENIRVESKGNYILLIMDNSDADKYANNFAKAI